MKTTTAVANRKVLTVKSGVRSGGVNLNHNTRRLIVKSGVRAGGMSLNHNVLKSARPSISRGKVRAGLAPPPST